MDLLAGHRFRLDDRADTILLGDFENVVPCGLGIRSPEDLGTARGDLLLELEEVCVEMVDRLVLGLGGEVARALPVPEVGFVLVALLVITAERFLDEGTEALVRRVAAGERLKIGGLRCHRLFRSEDLRKVEAADAALLLLKHSADLHEATGIVGDDGASTGLQD